MEKKEDSNVEAALLFVLLVPIVLVDAFTLYQYWNWFAVPFGAGRMSYHWSACALALANYVCVQTRKPQTDKTAVNVVAAWIMRNGVLLYLGFMLNWIAG